MTAKEKAKELRDKFLPILGGIEPRDWIFFNNEQAKQCAIVCVDVVLKNLDGDEHGIKFNELYWNEVKEEIQKL